VLTKFVEPLVLPGQEFFAEWKKLQGPPYEHQSIFKASKAIDLTAITSVLATGNFASFISLAFSLFFSIYLFSLFRFLCFSLYLSFALRFLSFAFSLSLFRFLYLYLSISIYLSIIFPLSLSLFPFLFIYFSFALSIIYLLFPLFFSLSSI